MTVLPVTSGSDIRVTLTLSEKGVPVNLSAKTLVVFEAAPGIAHRLSAVIADPVAGLIEVFLEGSSPLIPGLYAFRLQLNETGEDSIGLPEMTLKVT